MSDKTKAEAEVQHATTAGGPASSAGTEVPRASSDAVRRGMTGTQEALVSQGVPVTPHLDRDAAIADEAKRQSEDDARRAAFYKAEADAAKAAEKAREKATEGIPTHEEKLD